MSAPVTPFDSLSRRLAVYGYLGPLVAGRRVVEIGTGGGAGAARLRSLGASGVLGVDTDGEAVSRARSQHRGAGLDFRVLDRRLLDSTGGFDLVVVPDGAALFRAGASLTASHLRALCGPRGRLVVLVESADWPGATGGVGYYDVAETCGRLFPRVRMFGLTPFAAFGIAEFSEQTGGLRIDGGLVEETGEQPTHYLAVAGPEDEAFDRPAPDTEDSEGAAAEDAQELGYALVQIPVEGGGQNGAEAPAAIGQDADLRRRVAEAEGKAEGLLRVSRAQTEEIEELRARLRRGAESRAELDQEMTRLRRALVEADASVLDLTRRTTQEMAALASRITSGLRPEAEGAADGGSSRLREELRRREEELANSESALSERDDRIAALEAERQELTWRLSSAEAAAAEARTRPEPRQENRHEARQEPRQESRPERNDNGAAQRQRELALEQYRQAAAAHLDEVGRLREALAEQSTLVAELEDSLTVSGRRLQTALEETERVRQHAAEVEEADRARRSRLAEVEGTLLRLQRQTALANQPTVVPAPLNGASTDWEQKLRLVNQEWEQKVSTLQRRISDFDEQLRREALQRQDAEGRWGQAVLRLGELERALAEREAADSGGAAPVSEVGGGSEVSRLRELLERSEEQLWETKGQLLLDRERMAVLEHQLAEAPGEPTMTEAAHQSIMNAVYKELAQLEDGVRGELTRLETMETTVETWRADMAKNEGPVGPRSPLPRIE